MAFTLKIQASAYKGGPVLDIEIPNTPVDEHEAIKMGLGRAMYDGWIRSLTIEKQDKARRAYNAPATSGVRTKRGSAVNQAAIARAEAARAASEAARVAAESETDAESNAA